MGHLQPSFFMSFVKARRVSGTVSADFQTALCFCSLCEYFCCVQFSFFQRSPSSFFLMAWNFIFVFRLLLVQRTVSFSSLYVYMYIRFSFSGEPLGLSSLVTCKLLQLWHQTQGQPVMHRCGNFTEMLPYRQHPNSHLTR